MDEATEGPGTGASGAELSAALPQRQAETAEYIATLAEQLARMARDAKLDSLSYTLDVASIEARAVRAGTRKA